MNHEEMARTLPEEVLRKEIERRKKEKRQLRSKDQPLIRDKHGAIRFKANKYVDHLAHGKLNDLALLDYPQEDYEQLMQLIGYSLSGYCELSGVSEKSKDRAERKAEKRFAKTKQGGE